MAKGKSQSRKSKSAGSHRKKEGARSNLEVCPILGIMTFSPRYHWETSHENHREFDLRKRPEHLGFPRSATVSDPGFYGRPKSQHRSWHFNAVHTGGMAFPEFLAKPVLSEDGKSVVWENIPHDAHRQPVKVRDLPSDLRAHFIEKMVCAVCGQDSAPQALTCNCGGNLNPHWRKGVDPQKVLALGSASEARKQSRDERKLRTARTMRRIQNRACKLIREGRIELTDEDRAPRTIMVPTPEKVEYQDDKGVTHTKTVRVLKPRTIVYKPGEHCGPNGCGCEHMPMSAIETAAIQIGSLLSQLPHS